MSRPAGTGRAVAVLTAAELRQTARRGENVLVTLVIPAAVMVFAASSGMAGDLGDRPADFLLPGAIALAVIAAGLVNLGIATAYERSYGVLKRLGSAPISRSTLIAAKILAVLVLEVVQVALLGAVAVVALSWTPGSGTSPGLVVAAIALGTLAFAGIGLLMAGTLRAEATLALANAAFLVFLMVGGVILPIARLPEWLGAIAAFLPAAALSDALRVALGGTGDPGAALAILAAWGIAAAGLAARTFRWE
jgi:ABC-2 type transport system permease protein